MMTHAMDTRIAYQNATATLAVLKRAGIDPPS